MTAKSARLQTGRVSDVHNGLVFFGPAQQTNFAKRRRALRLHAMGASFLGAAVLLSQNGGDEYVVLHLVGQGVENILKSLLLLKDYDHYAKGEQKQGELQKLGHDLTKLFQEVRRVYRPKGRPLHRIEAELSELNKFYRKHWLRYDTNIDLFLPADSIKVSGILRAILPLFSAVDRIAASWPPDPTDV